MLVLRMICLGRLFAIKNHSHSMNYNLKFKDSFMADRSVVRRGDMVLIIFRFTLLALLVAFLIVIARTIWVATTTGSLGG